MPQSWRLIPEMVGPGTTHMAIDTWLLNQVVTGNCAPILRFYRWSPVAISLGYHQKTWPHHWQDLHWQGHGIELVRRPTGGRAVLHQGDFTYAVVLPMGSDRRQDLYKTICDALIRVWQRLGISLTYGTAGRGYHLQPNCFAISTPADLITASGYKLIGSAQLRRQGYLLQQGTMRLWPSALLWHQVFGKSSGIAPPSPIPKAFSQAWLSSLAADIVSELEKTLSVSYVAQPLTPSELQAASSTTGLLFQNALSQGR